MQARGLFVEQAGGRWCVRGRSYHKFFYQDERGVSFMARSALPALQRFPLTCYVKENGYLGIVFGRPGAAPGQTPTLVVASKSTTAGPFADRLRALLYAQLAARGIAPRDLAARLVRDNVSLVFEVVDPVFDPHIIKYAHAKLVLLDAIHNRLTDLVRQPYADAAELARELGVGHKRRYGTLGSLAEFDAFMRTCTTDEVRATVAPVPRLRPPPPRASPDARGGGMWPSARASVQDMMVDGRHVEGFVIEGTDGFMLKVKTAFYTHWKRVRTLKEALARARGKPARGRAGRRAPRRRRRWQPWEMWVGRVEHAVRIRDGFAVSRARRGDDDGI